MPAGAPSAVRASAGKQQGNGPATAGTSTYNPESGMFFGPGSILCSAGTGTLSGSGPTTLSQLLQQSLGG